MKPKLSYCMKFNSTRKALYVCETAEITRPKNNQRPSRTIQYLRKNGFDITLLTSKKVDEDIEWVHTLDPMFLEGRSLLKRAINSVVFSFKTLKFLDRNYDLVIFSQPDPLSNLSSFFVRRKNVCFEVRDIWPETIIQLYPNHFRLKVYYIFLKPLNKLMLSRAKVIFSALHAWEKYDDKVVFLPTLINPGLTKQYYCKKLTNINFVYFGHYNKQSNFDIFLKIFERVNVAEEVSLGIELFGKPPPKIVNSLEKIKVFKKISVRNSVSHEDFIAEASNHDIGLISFCDLPVYQHGLNSNRLSAYLEAGVIPFIFSKYSFEPCLEKLMGDLKADTIESSVIKIEKLINSLTDNPKMLKKRLFQMQKCRRYNTFEAKWIDL